VNSPEDGPVGPKHVEICRYMNKIEIVTSVGFSFHTMKVSVHNHHKSHYIIQFDKQKLKTILTTCCEDFARYYCKETLKYLCEIKKVHCTAVMSLKHVTVKEIQEICGPKRQPVVPSI
jgi:hypothetical protein